MKDNNKNYLYIAGVATGVIMAIISLLTSFQMINYVSQGGSFLVLMIVSIVVGVGVGALIAWLVGLVKEE